MVRCSLSYFKEIIHKRKQTLILIAIVITATLLLHTAISIWLSKNSNTHLPSFGTIYTLNVEVYGNDIRIQNGKKFIDWGIVYPGTLTNRTFNVTSKSNIQAILIIETANWIFYNSQSQAVKGPTNRTNYMSLNSNYNNTLINPNQTLELTLTLNITSSDNFINFLIESDVKSFSFDIHIYIKEIP
jgi:hypothetical protein